MLNDPIADMLTRIRNASRMKHRFVDVNLSKMNKAVLEVVKETGFISNYLVNDELKMIRIYLKYDQDRESLITNLRRVSSPGRRIYVKWTDVPVIRRGLGLSVVSTSRGVMSGTKAKKEKVGGELVCCLW